MTDNKSTEPASPFSDEALRRIAKEKIILALGVKIHVLAFFGVNAFLILLNYFVTSPGRVDWSIIVLSGWFVGLGIHAAAYLIYARGVIGGNKKALIIHLSAEILSVQAVVVINLLTTPAILWLVWPTSAMALAMLVHLIVYAVFLKGNVVKGQKKSWMDRQIDHELKKAGRQG
ncbi:MAG: 2TM domain-containing protein [Candidatus Lokiarchaeota archaeon]|nr:2TM domain-containing protein [Candidatus Lokiarchaeota archaeon]